MAKDLTTSQIDRQNILNNGVALPRIQEALEIRPLEFEGRYVLTKQMVADYYEVDERTIERFLEANKEELEHNGYFLCKGNSLKEFKLRFASDIDVATKTTVLGLFDFRSFLNIGMLLTESEKQKYNNCYCMKIPAKFKEYIWLVNTIRKARRITFAEINEKWLQTDMSEGIELARSTFARHKDAIEDIFGIYIDCDRQNGYEYYIGNDYVLREDSVQN